MRYPKLREVVEAVRAVVTGPYTSPFPAEPHLPPPSFRGLPRFDPEHCLGCLACEQVCPARAIRHEDRVHEDGSAVRIMLHAAERCIFCGQCQDACISQHMGIRLTTQWELACFDRKATVEAIEKPLQRCEACGEIIGTVDHLRWLARRLGARSFSSPTLYLSHLRELGLAETPPGLPSHDHARSDRFKILCARCRRTSTLA